MVLSLSSVLSAWFLTTFVLLLFIILLRSNGFIRMFGPQTAAIFFGLIMVRLVLPFEFFFTITIPVKRIYTTVCDFFHVVITLGGWQFRLYHLLLAVWMAGGIAALIRKGIFFYRMKKAVREFRYLYKNQEVLPDDELLVKYPELGTAVVLRINIRCSPMLTGLIKPVILLPDYPFTKEELYYVLGHEALHIRRHDLLWKYLIELLSCLYWWNPLMKRLQNDVFEMIEINNDLILTRELFAGEKETYMRCLAKISTYTDKEETVGAILFARKTAQALKRRWDFIAYNKKVRPSLKIAVFLCAGLITFLTAAIVFEPVYPAPEDAIELTSENLYAVYQNGRYDLYFIDEDGQAAYTETVDDLSFYPRGIVIYDEKGR